MPRFLLSRYVRETFGIEDHRAFRLCGMDEVGRGAFAGPLVAAAVVLPARFRHPLLRDSKRLTPRQRELVAEVIRQSAVNYEIAEVATELINARGLGWANIEVFRRLVERIEADGYCCDGRLRIDAVRPVHCLVGGDDLIPAISAASIVAKVHRDALMRRLHEAEPRYDWARNKGYGVPEHRAALRTHGTHPEHRTVFVDNLRQLDLALDAADAGSDPRWLGQSPEAPVDGVPVSASAGSAVAGSVERSVALDA